MKTSSWTLAALLGLALNPAAPPETRPRGEDPVFDHAHAAWTRILERCVRGGRFDYRALAESRGPFDEYLLRLRGVQLAELGSWTREQRLAYWINAYNAYTVHLILTRYPVESIEEASVDVPPWELEFIPLGHLLGRGEAEAVSLDALEQAVLRPQFEDARVHAALQRASESGPPLCAAAFQAEGLERQLEGQARAWLADLRLNRFDGARRRAEVSALFAWREADFARDAGSLRAWLARYAPERESTWLSEPGELALEHLPFSWKLNDVERE